MAQASSSKVRKRVSSVVSALDVVATIGLQISTVVFACSAVYLLWAIFEGNIASVMTMPTKDADRIVLHLVWACKALTVSGITLCICAGVKYRADNIAGYALLLWGILLCWGLPIIVNNTIRSADISRNWVQGALTFVIINAFKSVGIASMVVSGPFILVDFWYRLVGVRRDYPQARTASTEPGRNALIKYFCWQMPYCREHMRGYCQAFKSKKPCWRLKSGCYCDEDLLLRSMQKSGPAKVELLKDSFAQIAKSPTSTLTPAQKRARCRQCFIYGEHQKQKYRLISPLVFPAVAGALWVYYTPIMDALSKMLADIDKFAQTVSFVQVGQGSLGNQVGSSAISSDVANWILLGCLGLVIASYLLRGLEYLIFDLQV